MMVRFFAVAGNSCLAIRSLIGFLIMFGWWKWDLCQLWHKKRYQKVAAKLLLGRGWPANDDCSAFVGRSNTCLCVFLDFGTNNNSRCLSAALITMSLRFFRLLARIDCTKIAGHILVNIVRSSFQTNDQFGNFNCARSKCKTCPFIYNVDKMSEPKRSIAITDHFTCTSANVIHCIHCPYCKKLYIGETGRRLGDRFREHLRDVERNDKDISELVARHFNLPNHSRQHMAVCGLSLR